MTGSISKHGDRYGFAVRLDTTGTDARQLKRSGYHRRKDAAEALGQIRELIKLAGADDRMRRKIGDMIFASKYGRPLPSVEELRKRLGAGREPDAPSMTVGEWLDEWLTIRKRGAAQATYDTYRGFIENFLGPHLGTVQLDRLTARHVSDMLDWIEARNEIIRRARAEGTLVPDDPFDPRRRVAVTNSATQRQAVKVLRAALTYAVRKRRLIDRNVAADVDLPRVERKLVTVWTPEQLGRFLDATRDDRLHALYWVAGLRGLRQGELLTLTWASVELDEGNLTVRAGKTDSSVRVVALDPTTIEVLRRHRRRQLEERLATHGGYDDRDLVFAQEDGSPIPRHRVTLGFKRRARELGLPVIRFHDLRHGAATLNLEAGVDLKVVSDLLGHANTKITSDLYQHVRQQVHADAAVRVVELLSRSSSSVSREA